MNSLFALLLSPNLFVRAASASLAFAATRAFLNGACLSVKAILTRCTPLLSIMGTLKLFFMEDSALSTKGVLPFIFCFCVPERFSLPRDSLISLADEISFTTVLISFTKESVPWASMFFRFTAPTLS